MAKPVSLTPAGLAKRRRAASGLGRIGGGPEHVVGHLGMMQAQDWFGARGLTDARLDAAESIAREALSGTALGRAEFAKALAAGGLDPAEVYRYIVWLAVRGVVVWGPTAPPQQALVLLDEWAPATEPLPERNESIRRWTVCYLRGHGPATAEDVAWWTGLTLGDARRGIEAARDDLVEYDVQGEPMWALAAEHPPVPQVALLPPFDESVLSYRDRSRHLAEEHIEHVFPGSNGMFAAQSASVLVALERAAARYARFLGREMRYQLAPG